MRRWLSLFVPVALTLTALWALAGWREHEAALERADGIDAAIAVEVEQYLNRSLSEAIADLRIFASLDQTRALLDRTRSDRQARDALARLFAAVLEQKPLYARLRSFDPSGNEMVRVDRIGAVTVRQVDTDLESKAGRDFFTEASRLENGAVFISRFDLDMRGGRLVEPLRPMLRVSTPLRAPGEAALVLTLNLDGTRITEALHSIFERYQREGQLLDEDGYWLYADDRSRLWGRQRGAQRTLAQQQPELWSRMRESRGAGDRDGDAYFVPLWPLRSAGNVRGALADHGWWIVLTAPKDVFVPWYSTLLSAPYWMSLLLVGLAVGYLARAQGQIANERAETERRELLLADDEREQREVREQTYQLSLGLQNVVGLSAVVDHVLSTLATHLGATAGAFYCTEGDWLRPIGGYGLGADLVLRQFRRGDSLLAEALRQGRTIELDQLPPHYLVIRSGLGKSEPDRLVILPLLVRDRELGAIEFAVTRKLTSSVRLLLEQVLPLIALHLANELHRQEEAAA